MNTNTFSPAASPQRNASAQAAAPGMGHFVASHTGSAVHAPAAAPGSVYPVDPGAASLVMHPHAAVAMVAAAVQRASNQHQDSSPASLIANAAHSNLSRHQNPSSHGAAHPATPISAAQNISSHHPATVTSAAPAHSMGSVMAALFNSMGGSANAGNHHPPMSVGAHHAPVQYHAAAGPPPASASSIVSHPASHVGSIPSNPAAVAAAAAQVVAAHSAHAGPMTSSFLSNIKTWKLDQLESQVRLLREANQPIPQPLAMYLAEARRKEEKRTAKRVANRKSACTSRARKKALVEEMTRTNARLRRQAMILALLPDLVLAITVDGEITFCSAQVERVLRHKEEDLVGAKISDILVPASKEALQHLVDELVAAERAAASADIAATAPVLTRTGRAVEPNVKKPVPAMSANGNASGQSSSASGGEISSGGAAVVSDQSFPLSVVKVKNKQDASSGGDSDVSTRSNGGKPVAPVSSITNNSIGRSTSSFGVQTDETAALAASSRATGAGEHNQEQSDAAPTAKKLAQQGQTSSDESLSSSSDSKNLRKANEALSQNVRWHNEKLLGKSKTLSCKSAHKDDVTGASVTANNADARLSSLQHRPHGLLSPKKSGRYESLEEQSSSSSSDSLLAGVEEKKKRKDGIEHASEDSGYRESNDSQSSPEDTSDSSNVDNKERPKPLAPTCNVCLIRDDLTTVWCEVTSSIRTRSVKEPVDGPDPDGQAPSCGSESKTSQQSSADPVLSGGVVKELLLCLRPIRDGEEMVDESLRFVPSSRQEDPMIMEVFDSVTVTGDSNQRSSSSNDTASGHGAISIDPNTPKSRPPKKRPIAENQDPSKVSSDGSDHPAKKSRLSDDAEKSVVESLILMSNNSPSS